MPSAASIVQILWKYKNHEDLSEQELAELREWLEESPRHEDLFDDLSNNQKWSQMVAPLLENDGDATWLKIRDRIEELSRPEIKRRINWRPWVAAASVIFLVGIGFLVEHVKTKAKNENVIKSKNDTGTDILPSVSQVRLTLGNGQTVDLDSVTTGNIATEGNTQISKQDSGLNYISGAHGEALETYNTLTTGKGSTTKLLLPDSSVVWLNAGSSIRYPVAFISSTRSVELIGEAYFEVAKNKLKPFIVHSGNVGVRVLGTHFNIKAYPDEPLRTALLEGSIMLSDPTDSLKMKPGQEVVIDKGSHFKIESANADQVLAWRNGDFWFQETSFREIMQDISRHYDIDITFAAPVDATYSGILSQNQPLTAVLAKFEKDGNVHFHLEGRKLVISP